MKSKIDKIAKEYKQYPTTQNENNLATECLKLIKIKIKFTVSTTMKLTDPDDLESFLCLRTVQFYRGWLDMNKNFMPLYKAFLHNMTLNYLNTQNTLQNKNTVYSSGDLSNMVDTKTLLVADFDLIDEIRALKANLTHPVQIGIVEETEKIGYLNVIELSRRLEVSANSIYMHLDKIRKTKKCLTKLTSTK